MESFCDVSTEFYSETFPKAAKEHECCECLQPITKGTIHLYARGKSEGNFWAVRQCLTCRDLCMDMRDYILSAGCLCFGELFEFISNDIYEVIEYTKKEKKYQRLRTFLAERLWDSERTGNLFFRTRDYEHRPLKEPASGEE